MSSNRSVARAVSVLRALAASPNAATATDIAKKVGLPRATTFRLLLTLEEEGFVDRNDTQFSLGWDLARLAQSVDPAAGIVARVRPTAEEIADRLGETVTLSVRKGVYELDVVLQQSPRSIGVTISDMRGMRWPLHASATGKLLLAELEADQVRQVTGETLASFTAHTIKDHEQLRAELDRIRDQGWAKIDDELEDGIFSVSMPLRDNVGEMFAALAVVMPKHRLDHGHFEGHQLPILRDGALQLQKQLASGPAG
ncbi:IclR family transcriptional regulator [Arthrobacter sp. JZ12]|uniref:IclR family transcriptional regulator n=1 Tax=Arthrobacter sp. JZ12 TaxID=2654190 RepID=UPI002B48AE6F|nr:IclR family transcriptional regulator [Arthrobacter sp. JZ12]